MIVDRQSCYATYCQFRVATAILQVAKQNKSCNVNCEVVNTESTFLINQGRIIAEKKLYNYITEQFLCGTSCVKHQLKYLVHPGARCSACKTFYLLLFIELYLFFHFSRFFSQKICKIDCRYLLYFSPTTFKLRSI